MIFRLNYRITMVVQLLGDIARDSITSKRSLTELQTDGTTGKPRSPKAAWSNIWSLPLPSRDTSSTQAYQKVQTWIETCFKNHAHCSKNEISQLPKRVLQITESFVYLCEFAEKQEKYACLSHCWGPKGPLLQLTPETKDTLQRGIRRAELPRTFADAVEICDRLRISYIWIDALCKCLLSKIVVCSDFTEYIERYHSR
jgi:hypothetical protein